jgi:transposase-like protein
MVRQGREPLSGTVEVDEAYIGGLSEGHPGRGSSKALVVLAVECLGTAIGRVRMRLIESSSAKNLLEFIQDNVLEGSTIVTDGWGGYSRVADSGYIHQVRKMNEDKKALPHVHRVISLLKRWLLGTMQGAVSKECLDYYLDEYTFRFNRRTSKNRGKLFFRLVEQSLQCPPVTRDGLRLQKPTDFTLTELDDYNDDAPVI